MDALGILSVAAAVVQFADFGTRVLQESINVYTGISLARARIVELAKISNELTQLTHTIDHKMAPLSQAARPLTIIEMQLLEQCRRCKAAGEEVLQCISIIRGHGVSKVNLNQRDMGPLDWQDDSKLGSFRTALSLVWKEEEIEKLERKLVDVKSGLMSAMISHIWERFTRAEECGSPTHMEANESTTRGSLVQQLRSESQQNALAAIIGENSSSDQQHSAQDDPLPPILRVDDASCTQFLLSSLRFISLENRAKAIPVAYQNTYNWIFERPPQSQDGSTALCPDFTTWLENDSKNVYWITGKPGSGKSTMMRHLIHHPRTREHLRMWSPKSPVHVISFYSWNAGEDDLQRSQEGLLRTLLYQIIEAVPEVALKILPSRWAMLKLFGEDAVRKMPEWKLPELYEAVTSLDLGDVDQKFKLAIFVDGLDEFDGDYDDLIDLMRVLRNRSGIKLCVSSRPWNEFRDAFCECPQLRMEKLTERDMATFVRGSFQTRPSFRDLSAALPSEAEDLIQQITRKAEGIFLWVAIVTRLVLEGLREGDLLADLKLKLEDLPSDLSDLYSSLWRGIKPQYKKDGARLLSIFETFHRELKFTGPRHLTAERLWFADDGHRGMTREQIIANLTRRLTSRTRDLLEISVSGVVEYLHRTARDWMRTYWDLIAAEVPKDFDPHLGLVLAISSTSSDPTNWGFNRARQTFVPWFRYYDKSWKMIAQCFYHASRMTVRNEKNCKRLAEALDDLAETLALVGSSQTRNCPLPYWAGLKRDPPHIYGMVSLAAEFGVLHYVRVKVMSGQSGCYRYLKVMGDDDDILWRLINGPVEFTFAREFETLIQEAKKLTGIDTYDSSPLADQPSLKQAVNRIRGTVSVACPPQDRYLLAQDILQKMKETPREFPGFEKQLRALYKEVTADTNGESSNLLLASQITVTKPADEKNNDRPNVEKSMEYGKAIEKLLENYGVVGPIRARIRRWSTWLSNGSSKSGGSALEPEQPWSVNQSETASVYDSPSEASFGSSI
ncbi:hypothetical protein QBC45DRAFT_97682 [Copromyces sp. CBS 386.78]|nr:hypothetical protein QBC45DRAFT_97682 [Copromyces sp. CBS 386.78]